MFFSGTSDHTIDAKLRLAVPARYRNQWDALQDGSGWYCIPWPSGHLRLYTEGRFRKLARDGDASEQGFLAGEDETEFESTLFGLAEKLDMDTNGRIQLPRTHMELIGLESEVVVVGARDRLEVHGRTRWKEGLQQRLEKLPGLIAKIQEQKRVSASPTA